MLIKGDKIKQVKEINGFNRVGDIFEVVDIDGNSISIKSDIGVGIMSYCEFEKYFEKVVEETWSEWKTYYYNDKHLLRYRTKGRLTECEFSDGIHTFSKNMDEDEYDLEKGIKVCIIKYEIKLLQNKLKEY